jgi:hypothetical protein
MTGGERNEVGEPFHRNYIAILEVVLDRLRKRENGAILGSNLETR